MAENKDAVKNTEAAKAQKAPKTDAQKTERELKAEKLKKLLENRTDFEAKLIKAITAGKFGLVDKRLLSKDKEVIFNLKENIEINN